MTSLSSSFGFAHPSCPSFVFVCSRYTGWLFDTAKGGLGKVFDTNVSKEKAFRFKLGKGKVGHEFCRKGHCAVDPQCATSLFWIVLGDEFCGKGHCAVDFQCATSVLA